MYDDLKTGAALLPFLPTNEVARRAADETPALIDDRAEGWTTYGQIRATVSHMAQALEAPQRGLVLCCLPRSVEGAQAYLACVHAGHAIALVEPSAPNLAPLLNDYEPEWLLAPRQTAQTPPTGYARAPCASLQDLVLYRREKPADRPSLHPDFFLMLLTSGSTGSGKGVRLSYHNVASNTLAIIKSLDLTAQETALCHLPLPYSFGLSVLHTQLAVGGRCVLSDESLMSGDLWALARRAEATLFPGVPYHYEIVMRLGLARLKVPTLKTFLQAGGKMHIDLTRNVLKEVQERRGRLFIMYGQTEAAPRISCFPLHERPEKIGSSGVALDGGRLDIEGGEVIYTGPNVMMGHALRRDDLALGDIMNGRLATGDLGAMDEEGFLTITGREQRFAKLFGRRVALDDLESIAAPRAPVIAVETPDAVVVLVPASHSHAIEAIADDIVERTKLPRGWIRMRTVPSLPHRPNGKLDYPAAAALAQEGDRKG